MKLLPRSLPDMFLVVRHGMRKANEDYLDYFWTPFGGLDRQIHNEVSS